LIVGQQEVTSLGIDGIIIYENGNHGLIVVFIFALTYCVITALLVMV
jgi:hypothetical protein